VRCEGARRESEAHPSAVAQASRPLWRGHPAHAFLHRVSSRDGPLGSAKLPACGSGTLPPQRARRPRDNILPEYRGWRIRPDGSEAVKKSRCRGGPCGRPGGNHPAPAGPLRRAATTRFFHTFFFAGMYEPIGTPTTSKHFVHAQDRTVIPEIEPPARPRPVARVLDHPSYHGIVGHVIEFPIFLLRVPDVRVVEPPFTIRDS
jgi:hypothetical protein